MKYDKQKAFPYPVLVGYCDDYIDGEFQTIPDFTVENDAINVSIIYQLSSEAMLDQIEQGNAAFATTISCRETYFRCTLTTAERFQAKEFSSSQLRGEVKADSYVVVLKHIDNFGSQDINPEFGPGPFVFEPGHILAQSEPQVVFLEREMFNPLTSVFELVKKNDLPDNKWSVFFDEDHIQIEVSPKMKEILDNARNTRRNKIILLNSLYFAAVMEAIQSIKNKGGHEDKKWHQVIEKKAHNIGCDLESQEAHMAAQTLMRHPLGLFDAYRIFKGED